MVKLFDNIVDWLIKKTSNKLNREDIVVGLVVGLVGGLVWGLVWGLVVGLVVGLVWGLVGGLVWGLVRGLVWGLVRGLVWGLVWGLVVGLGSLISVSFIAYFQEAFIPYQVLILIILIIAEMLFLLFDEKNPKKKENKFWFTAKRKAISVLKSAFFTIEFAGFSNLIRKIIPSIRNNWGLIVKWLGYVGIAFVCLALLVGLLYAYVWLNSQKYNQQKRKV